MSWWDDTKGFFGGAKDWMFGGNATEGMNTKPAHADYMGNYIQGQLDGVQGRQAPTAQAAQLGQAAQLNTQQADAARAQQNALAQRLMAIGAGQQKGAGEMAVDRQVGQAQAAQQAQALMARGSNTGLAMRNAARNQAGINLAGTGQAAIAQQNDQNAALGQLGGVLGQMRGQDTDIAGQNANLLQQRMMQQGAFNQQTNLANQGAALQQRGMNDQASLGYLASLLGIDQASLQQDLLRRQMDAQDKGMFPTLLQTGGQIGAAAATGGAG